jgi:hypothetical protein
MTGRHFVDLLRAHWRRTLARTARHWRTAAIALLGISIAAALAASSATSTELSLTPKQWQADLEFYARELPRRHLNAFHHTSREQFGAAAQELKRTLEHANGDEAYVGFKRLAALIGDGHTGIGLPEGAFAETVFPLTIERFDNEYRIVAAAPELEKAVGASLVKVQDIGIAEIVQKLKELTPQDELPGLTSSLVVSMLTRPRILHGSGILPSRDSAHFTLADDTGRQFIIEIQPVSIKNLDKSHWLRVGGSALSEREPAKTCYFIPLPDSRAVYCNVRLIRDLAGPGKELINYLKKHQGEIDKLIIDLRQNGGGDYFVGLRYLVEPIRKLAFINRKGHLFVLIGPDTFSAAMSNATHFRARTQAILVGEPIGEKPNSYAERREMRLPNSRLVASYSVRYYQFIKGGENIVRPDHEVRTSWGDFKKGLDPALQWALDCRWKGS